MLMMAVKLVIVVVAGFFIIPIGKMGFHCKIIIIAYCIIQCRE